MSYEQFWYGSAELYWAYQTAFIKKEQYRMDMDNKFAWLQGLYIYQGVSAALSNSNRSKESDPISNYIQEPIDFTKDKNDIIKSRQEELENKMRVYMEVSKIKLDKKGNK